jgi:hypothetical protein
MIGKADMRRATLNSRKFFKAWMLLQTVHAYAPKAMGGRINKVMDLLDEQARRLRRAEIFAAGAKARKLPNGSPVFNGHTLGSSESYTFYDGHASTHKGFKNPYRSTQ